MNKTKFIVRVAVCVALLIAGQLALNGIQGVEVVTVMLLCFCYCYGLQTGIAIATTFSLLRCFIFGFQVDIIALYLIYYNLFALFFGWLGSRFGENISFLKMLTVILSAAVFTVFFTALDNTIKILAFGMRGNVAKVYVLQSLPTMTAQTICTLITVPVFFVPLTKVIRKINF